MVTLIGIDMGRGETKATMDDGRMVTFPSVVGRTVDRRFRQVMPTLDRNGEVGVVLLRWDGIEKKVHRLVGQEAMDQSASARAELAHERKEGDVIALVAESLLQLDVSGEVKIVLGAPVDYYTGVRARWVLHVHSKEDMLPLEEIEASSNLVLSSLLGDGKENRVVEIAGKIETLQATDHGVKYTVSDPSGTVEIFTFFPQHIPNPEGREIWAKGRTVYQGKYRDFLRGEWSINGVVKVDVTDVKVLPEPAGTWTWAALDFQGKVKDASILRGMTGVVDVGTFTTDCCVFGEGGKFREPLSFSIPMGMAYVSKEIQRFLLDHYSKDLDYFRLTKELKERRTQIAGVPVDLSRVIDGGISALAEVILSELDSRWGNIIGMDRILVTGGGAYYLFNAIAKEHKQAEMVAEPELSNVRGFRAFAHWIW